MQPMDDSMSILALKKEIKNILVIEDNQLLAKVIKLNLEFKNSVKVTCVGSLAEARTILSKKITQFSLALIDLHLPDASGVEIIETVNHYNIPSVAFTGSFDPELAETMYEHGVIDYVIKGTPASIEYIQSVVHRLLVNPTIKVLIVDDSEIQLQTMSALCRRYQLKVLQAKNGVEALKIIDNNPDISLVLTDYHMPEMDGFELTHKIRAKYPRNIMAIIAISSVNKKGLSAQFIKIGANDFISKPFDSEEFFCRISQNLDHLDFVKELDYTASRDFLTGLRNRRSYFDISAPLLAGIDRRQENAVVAMIDVDNFKEVNDTYGHDIGDQVLVAISHKILSMVRESDVAGRMGGEEFSVFSVDMDSRSAEEYFNKLCRDISTLKVPAGGEFIQPTVSIGVYIGSHMTMSEMLAAADKRLYEAKALGRNRVILNIPDSKNNKLQLPIRAYQ